MPRSRAGRLRTIVYVDGFNLYYGCLKDSAERWLDLGALCERLLREDTEIVGIKYFAARVKPRPGNPEQAQRQQTYFRALATVPNLTIHYGHFITRVATRRCVKDRGGKPTFADVWITEEKGSDVNFASHLLIDGFRVRYDLAVVISNDSDLKEPIEFVRHDLGVPVGVLNPHRNRSYALSPKETFHAARSTSRSAERRSGPASFPHRSPMLEASSTSRPSGMPLESQRPPRGGLASLPPRRTGGVCSL